MKWIRRHRKISFLLGLVSVILIYAIVALIGQAIQKPQPIVNAIVPIPASVAGLYDDIEQQRQLSNTPALIHNPALDTSAQNKCNDMVTGKYYDHINPSTGKKGASFIFDSLPSATVGDEIINQGDNPNHIYTSDEFMSSWMNSPDHKSAIIDPQYTDVGFALCTEGGESTVVGHLAVLPKQSANQAPQQTTMTRCMSTYNAGLPQYGIQPSVSTHCF